MSAAIREKVSQLEELYDLRQDSEKEAGEKQSLAQKLLAIYQYFSDEARIPTYLQLTKKKDEIAFESGTD